MIIIAKRLYTENNCMAKKKIKLKAPKYFGLPYVKGVTPNRPCWPLAKSPMGLRDSEGAQNSRDHGTTGPLRERMYV